MNESALFAYSKKIFPYEAMAKRSALRHQKDWETPAVRKQYLEALYQMAKRRILPGVKKALQKKPVVGLVSKSGNVYITRIGTSYAFIHTEGCMVLDASQSGIRLSTVISGALDRKFKMSAR